MLSVVARALRNTLHNHIDIPETVRVKALAAGAAGGAWLAGLDTLVADLARAWGLELGATLRGGTESYVVAATVADGRAAVLKILPPDATTNGGEFSTLLSARGRGYAEVYAVDTVRGAVLMERLGSPLATLGLMVDAQIAILCAMLVEAWTIPPADVRLTNGAEKAQGLSDFIATTSHALGRPCSPAVIDLALRYADERRRSFAPHTAVLAHGDAHAWNALAVLGESPTRCKFVDPDGLFIERAYDLAIPMREWSDELLAGDPLRLGMARCHHLAALTGVAPEPIWQWGFIERVSTGLLCLKLGLAGGDAMLAVAERWADAAWNAGDGLSRIFGDHG